MAKSFFDDDLSDEEEAFPLDNIRYTLRRSNIVNNDEEEEKDLSVLLVFKYFCLLGFALSIVLGVSVLIHNMTSAKLSHSCQCSINDHFPENDTTSIILETNTKVEYTANGERRCKSICTSLAQKAPSLYRKKICEKQHDVNKYLGTLYYRPGAQSIWQPTDFQVTVCCRRGAAYVCSKNTPYN